MKSLRSVLCSMAAIALVGSTLGIAAGTHTTSVFTGAKVNGGTVTHAHEGGRVTLTLSDDFQVPDTPAPSWQVVDSKGNVYLLNQLRIKGDKINRTVVVPSYVHDIAKVQIWCSFAETLLGEASFDRPVM